MSNIAVTVCMLIKILLLINGPAGAQVNSASPLSPHGFGNSDDTPAQNCISREALQETLQSLYSLKQIQNSAHLETFPWFGWPLADSLDDGISLVNYYDHDAAPNVVSDYQCLDHTYDGHFGTDFGIYHFRAMDEGRAVLAAAPGTVVLVDYSQPDRNLAPSGLSNKVVIQHGDTTLASYLHLRRNSVTVNVGETVEVGQMLGYAASSGFSSSPHLHFEAGYYDQFGYHTRDPWEGPCNALPNLWQDPLPYVGDDPLRILDMGIYTHITAGGNPNHIPRQILEERLTQPWTTGIDEPVVGVWALLQGQAGDNFTLSLLKPDSSLFASASYTLPGKIRRNWYYWNWDFADFVSPADTGRWSAVISAGGEAIEMVRFEVGANTCYAPRFQPLAGRSLRLTGGLQRDTLRVSALGVPVTYSLLNAPDYVTLEDDSIVTISGAATQISRSVWFQALATDSLGLTDTMRYHIVDPAAPIVGLHSDEPESNSFPATLELKQNYPNPFNPSTTIEFSIPKASFVNLMIYNILGEQIARPVSEKLTAGNHQYHWNAGGLPSGMYFYKIETGNYTKAKKALLLK